MKTLFIGIDPGEKGGIAHIHEINNHIETVPYSNDALLQICQDIFYGTADCQNIICCLEKVGAMPKQGVVSMFNFGQSAGYIKGVLEAYRIPYQEITPRKWKQEFGLNSDKTASAEVCRKLFPDINLLATPRSKKPHDGMAEALLMAEYARRKL